MNSDFTDNGVLRFLTCGSVDDGKSTLIGRVLHDTQAILADTLAHVEHVSQRKGLSALDLSLLTDGLQAEREQGITIDVAYRYFSTGRRKYIVADAPGHDRYTRNMVTAASTAHLALILVDARHGVVTQTRRHSCIAHLIGIQQFVVVVNKMDLVGYDRDVYNAICANYATFALGLGIPNVRFIPISALNGDMVVERRGKLPWYDGPTLLEVLESAPAIYGDRVDALRFPIQYVRRPQASSNATLHDYRGFVGRVESGSITVGDSVTVLPSREETRIKAIHIGDRSIDKAVADQSVTLQLEDKIDVSRGDMIVAPQREPRVVKQIDAMICWLSETSLDPQRRYRVRHTTRETQARVSGIRYRLDINSLEKRTASQLAMNDIARASLSLAQPLCVDAYADNRSTGSFIIIDESTFNTVGAGIILDPVSAGGTIFEE